MPTSASISMPSPSMPPPRASGKLAWDRIADTLTMAPRATVKVLIGSSGAEFGAAGARRVDANDDSIAWRA